MSFIRCHSRQHYNVYRWTRRRCYSTTSEVTSSPRPQLHVLRLDVEHPLPILAQLRLEEALFRGAQDNFILFNRQSPAPQHPPAVVMGVSGQVKEWLTDQCRLDRLTTIKRYSGGGTVYIDQNTLLVTLIINKADSRARAYPRELMAYATSLFTRVFRSDDVSQRGHDLCIGQRKIAGNAQAISKDRFMHHTSLLYDYDTNMIQRYLLMPKQNKQPEYRQNRLHSEFLCKLKDFHYNHQSGIIPLVNDNNHNDTDYVQADNNGGVIFAERLVEVMSDEFEIVPTSYGDVSHYLDQKHDRLTKVIDWNAYEQEERSKAEQVDTNK